jgi:hypothetical protein
MNKIKKLVVWYAGSSNTTGATCGAGTAYPSEHPSFWAIMKLCSFSWTFPENSRRPGGFYFYMMCSQCYSQENDIQMHLKDPSKYFSFSSRPKIAFRLKLFWRFKINELIDFIWSVFSSLDIIKQSQPHGLVLRICTTLCKTTNPCILS